MNDHEYHRARLESTAADAKFFFGDKYHNDKNGEGGCAQRLYEFFGAFCQVLRDERMRNEEGGIYSELLKVVEGIDKQHKRNK